MKSCRPKGRCLSQAYPATNPSYFASVMCAPDDGWWDVISGQHLLQYGERQDFYVGGCPCYGFSLSDAAAGFGTGGLPIAQWFDAYGRFVALSVDYPHQAVTCGPFYSLSSPAQAVLPDGRLAPGFTAYDVDPYNPDCAPWQTPTCEPGCCPAHPPALPATAR